MLHLGKGFGYVVKKNHSPERSVTPMQYMVLALRRVPHIFLDIYIYIYISIVLVSVGLTSLTGRLTSSNYTGILYQLSS